MSRPTDRASFKEFCLRTLGKPVIEINVDEDQVDDRVDEALQYFWDYNFNGLEKMYYKYQIQPADMTNKYITLPANVRGAIRLFDINSAYGIDGMFGIKYQIALNDLYTLTSQPLAPYVMAMYNIAEMQQWLVGHQPIRYTQHKGKAYLDMDWTRMQVGQYIILECYEVIDPDTYTAAWNDKWLQRYATALIKRQWGANLTKFIGLNLPGGVQFNGQKIYDDAQTAIDTLEAQLLNDNPPEAYLMG